MSLFRKRFSLITILVITILLIYQPVNVTPTNKIIKTNNHIIKSPITPVDEEQSILVDIRSTEKYQLFHFPHSISVPFQGCPSCLLEKLEKYRNKNIILYFDSKEKGRIAYEILKKHGYKNIHNLTDVLPEFIGSFLLKTESNTERVRGENLSFSCGAIPLSPDVVTPEKVDRTFVGDLPPEWDWRNATYNNVTGDWTTPVKNQGHCGSCWDFAAHGALEAVINIEYGNPDLDYDLSEQYILSCANLGGCRGSNAYWAYRYMYQNGGALLEDCFPYQADDTIPCSEKCSNWEELLIPIAGYGYWYRPSREFIKSKLIEYGPLCTCMAVYSDFGSYRGGIYEHPGEEPTSDINHQVVLVGYKDDPSLPSGGCWICKNSWGTSWGENGFFKIAYGDCQIEYEIVYVKFNKLKPNTPTKPEGPTNVKKGKEYLYTTYSIDSQNEMIQYCFDWGDGIKTWTEWKYPGEKVYVTHIWQEEGTFDVKVKARNRKEIDSSWSQPLTVNVSENKQSFQFFINKYFPHYPPNFLYQLEI